MVHDANFALFISGSLLLNLTPGPDMAFTIASATRGGVRAGIAAALGVGAGSLGWAIATAAGLAALLAASEHAFTLIKIAGGLYLLYLAVRALTETQQFSLTGGAADAAKSFRAGVLTNLFNPKVGLFFLAFLPGFTDPSAANPALQILLLGGFFSATGTCVLVFAALAAGALRRRLVGSRRSQNLIKAFSSSIFAGLGFYLLLSDER